MIVSIIFSRYLLKTFFKWLGVNFIAFSFIIALSDFTELLRKTATRFDVHFDQLVSMLLLKLPHLVGVLLPFIILFSSLLTFWHLGRHRELEVARASGISVWQILSPLLGTALLIGLFDLTLINPISSELYYQYEKLHNKIIHKKSGALLIEESGLWVREVMGNEQRFIHIKYVEKGSKLLKNIVVLRVSADHHFLGRLDAHDASLQKDTLFLRDVWETKPHFAPMHFESLSIPTSLTMTSLKNSTRNPDVVSFWKLPSFIKLLENSGLSSVKYVLQWHTLIARCFWLAVMVILAATCTMSQTNRSGFLKVLAIGLFIAFTLYFFRDIALALGAASNIPPILAAWIPIGVSFMIGLSLLIHQEDG